MNFKNEKELITRCKGQKLSYSTKTKKLKIKLELVSIYLKPLTYYKIKIKMMILFNNEKLLKLKKKTRIN